MLPKKILYFIRGSAPTEHEFEDARKVGTFTFRSLAGYGENDFIEQCDAVAGLAPDRYRAKYPYASAPDAPAEVAQAPAGDPPKPWDKKE